MKKAGIIILLLLIKVMIFSQDVELNRVNAKEEFKWGVRFYNQGLYEKSVFSFERSLSYDSLDSRTHLWLGRAYYMKGDVEAALKEWAILSEIDTTPLWLQNSMDIISAGRGVVNTLYQSKEWVPLYIENINRPSSILTKNDGSTIVVSFMENKLTELNSNGAVINVFNGGFEPFNRPYDIIENGKDGYIVSEFMGDKITFIDDLGVKIKSINPENSPLSGPGYLSKDNSGYFYVSDWGNRRVCKFDMDGEFILSFSHEKLKGPSGILAIDDTVYVADQLNKTVLIFDSSGNYIDTIIDENLVGPEGLSYKNSNVFLIADGTTLKEYHIDTQEIHIVTDLQGKASRITKGVVDINGNTLAIDFNRSEYYALADLSSLYGGLYMVIDRISSKNFPKMQIEIQVYNRLGEPLIGLDNSNFLITESSKIVGKRNIVYRGSQDDSVNLGLILDFDISMSSYFENFYDLSKSIENEIHGSDNITLIKAGIIPEVVVSSKQSIIKDVSKFKPSDFVVRDGIDLSIKLAASSLIPSWNKREIVLFTSGESKDSDFVKYTLDEIRDFLVNNRMSLTVVYVGSTKNEELEYLVNETNGTSRNLFSGIGSKGIVEGLREKKSGFYVLDYESLRNIDNGEIYTSVEVEVNYIRKSGRTESGFFVPVKVVE
ncbi:MAG: hypothetical protein OCD02_13650 [Spirochaetaceae bacterium]